MLIAVCTQSFGYYSFDPDFWIVAFIPSVGFFVGNCPKVLITVDDPYVWKMYTCPGKCVSGFNLGFYKRVLS